MESIDAMVRACACMHAYIYGSWDIVHRCQRRLGTYAAAKEDSALAQQDAKALACLYIRAVRASCCSSVVLLLRGLRPTMPYVEQGPGVSGHNRSIHRNASCMAKEKRSDVQYGARATCVRASRSGCMHLRARLRFLRARARLWPLYAALLRCVSLLHVRTVVCVCLHFYRWCLLGVDCPFARSVAGTNGNHMYVRTLRTQMDTQRFSLFFATTRLYEAKI